MAQELTEIFTGMPQGAEAIQDNFQKLNKRFQDTGVVTDAITFLNGAYDWGLKNNAGNQYSFCRKTTMDNVDTIVLEFDIGVNKDINPSDGSIIVAQLPNSMAVDGNLYIPIAPNTGIFGGVQGNQVKLIQQAGTTAKNTRISIKYNFIQDKGDY